MAGQPVVSSQPEEVVAEVEGGSVADGGAVASPKVSDDDILLHRERVRGTLALLLLGLLALIAAGALVILAFGLAPATDIKDVATLLFSPLVGVFGAVTGFYYSGNGKATNRRGE